MNYKYWSWWNYLTETEQERVLGHFYENCEDFLYSDEDVVK